ncbi:c-type cytochrome [Hymenobacter sp. BRD67]|uniref:c-type cytochrome n=1 Tax=Hymenobacter sp. BRD67 TaxID=2675877 RepID=UPI001564C6AF|nr:cytochrome c [Hymenobacter sp. BRD67]QKG51805.1 cytochrome c [Hymenobacter sp. BRD67]
MRTNPAAFALSLGMGLIVLLIGFLTLSAAGLVSLAPVEDAIAERMMPADEAPAATRPGGRAMPTVAYQPASPADAAAVAAGDALFKNNCAQCHAVNDKVVGPALGGISRRRSVGWVVGWVHNSSKVIASGDEYAVKLFEDNARQQMPAFPQLSKTDIEAIMVWVSAQEGAAASATVAATR